MTRQTPDRRRPRPSPGSKPAAPGSHGCGERGAVAVEYAIGIPLLVLVVLLAAGSFAMARATIDVNTAASSAARAASLSRDAAAARSAAADAAHANLAGRCVTLTVHVDTNAFRRGGSVTVTVACTVSTQRLTGLGLPGTTTLSAASTSPVDVFRSVSAGFGFPSALAPHPHAGARHV
jgi:Flp pilus assembly protein TadG